MSSVVRHGRVSGRALAISKLSILFTFPSNTVPVKCCPLAVLLYIAASDAFLSQFSVDSNPRLFSFTKFKFDEKVDCVN